MPAVFDMLPGILGGMFPVDAHIIAALDPDREVPDVRPNNNYAAVPVQLQNECVDDDDRTNEGPATATALDPEANEYRGTICAFTQDWFSYQIQEAGSEITLIFRISKVTLTYTYEMPQRRDAGKPHRERRRNHSSGGRQCTQIS